MKKKEKLEKLREALAALNLDFDQVVTIISAEIYGERLCKFLEENDVEDLPNVRAKITSFGKVSDKMITLRIEMSCKAKKDFDSLDGDLVVEGNTVSITRPNRSAFWHPLVVGIDGIEILSSL